MRLSSSGRLVLDSTSTIYGLEVKISYMPSSGAWITIKAEAVVQGQAFYTNSDQRIKKNIVDVPDNLALQYVRDIPCRYYDYINQEANGGDKTIGFIAQEVKEVFPMAVNTNPDFIPDEYRLLENISWIPTSDNQFKLVSDLINVSGVKYRFYVPENNEIPSVRSKRIEVIGNSDNTFTFDVSHQQVFCYGKEVDDFHTIDKNKIFALHHSAIQELDRQLQEEKNKRIQLESQLADILARLNAAGI